VDFPVRVSENLREMDERIFREAAMDIREEILSKEQSASTTKEQFPERRLDRAQ